MNTITLHCEAGNHDWERERQRGRQPKNCPDHKPEVKAVVPTAKNEAGEVELHCEIGNHAWSRPAQKGARPRNCPEHRPEKAPQGGIKTAVAVAQVDEALVAAFMESHKVSAQVARAFVAAGEEPPHDDSIRRRGYSAHEVAIVSGTTVDTFNDDEWEAIL